MNAQERARKWEELLANPIYKELMDAFKGQVDSRMQDILYGELTHENIYDREMKRGELVGVELCIRMAETMAEQAQIDLTNALKEMSNDSQEPMV